MGVQSDISAALDVALSTLAKAVTPEVPVVWPNKVPASLPTSRYLQVWKMPSSTDRASIGKDGWNEYDGIYQISIFDPINQSARLTETEADRICAGLKVGTVLTYGSTTVTITQVHQAPAIPEATRYHLPISVYYRALSQS